ncbi:hypothetical protein J2S66_005484 [Saccharothrix longispora]|uniref:DUF3073 family protein n=1 Tax=Saccharothrix longispora TaxID=33920 RepID=A0ABU1Q2G8_9PSEU|nr:hypothetical protein [Saccharothrix longispora]
MARELKYSSHNIDVDALQRELSSGESAAGRRSEERFDDPSDDEYDDYRR